MRAQFDFNFLFVVILYFNFRLEDMKDQLRKRMFTKRRVNKFKFTLVDGLSIELNSYALIRPTVPGKHFLLFSS
jgi:hypothetical protein